ncbi:hypothetical protein ACKLNR_007332 [Fusarium oxysporum f. sp. zingiberi]
MRYSLVFALWCVGALSGPCNPVETSGSTLTPGGGPDECQDGPAETSAVSQVESLSNVEAAVETSIAPDSHDDENGQVSVSIHSTELSQASIGAENSELPSPQDTELVEDGLSAATTTGIAEGIVGQTPVDATSAVATNAGSADTQTAPADAGTTDSNMQTTEGQSNDTEDVPAATSSVNLNEGQSTTMPIPVDSDGPPTGTVASPDTMTDSQSPEQTVLPETTALVSDKTSAADTSSENVQPSGTETDAGAQSTTHGVDTTSKPVADNPDTASSQVASNNDRSSDINTVTETGDAASSDGGDGSPATKTQGDDIPPMTSNPVTTAAPDAMPAPTVTDVPEGLAPTTVTGHPEWVSNTWITTTGDSSESTVVPVLVGCPGCGGKGSGIVLFGFPKVAGTWFKLPGLPKFKFPCIPPVCTTSPDTPEDGDDGDDDDDDDNKSSSTTCTDKVTVTDCFVACTTYTGPAGSTVTPDCQTTCTKTHTGCDVVGTTTTSSAAACGPSGNSSCKSCELNMESQVDPDEIVDYDSEGNTEEDAEEDTEEDTEQLQRRAPEPGDSKNGDKQPDNIGGCKEIGTLPKFPEYPGGWRVLNNDDAINANDSPLKAIKRWWLTTRDANCVPELKGNLPAADFNLLRGDKGRPSIDHIYEKVMLLDFFRHIIDTDGPDVRGATDNTARDKISCNDLAAYGGTGSDSNNNLLQKVFDAFPGAKDSEGDDPTAVVDAQYLEDFIGMDQWTNGDAKGFVAKPQDARRQCNNEVKPNRNVVANTPEARAQAVINEKLDKLEKLGIGIQMFSATEAVESMVRQNQRLYAKFLDMDANAKGCMDDPAVKNGIWSFADAYKTYMVNRFEGDKAWSINHLINQSKTKLIKKLQSDLEAAPQIKSADEQAWKIKVEQWKLRLSKWADSEWTWPVPEWTWESVTKRDGDGLSCKRPIPSLTSSEPTTFATSTRTTSDDSTEKPSSEEMHSTTEAATSTSAVTTSSTKRTGPTIGERPGWFTDAPTLSDRLSPTISTPDGSSCTKTVTESMCNLGVGRHENSCYTHTRCDAWVNTKTTSKPSPSPTLASPKFSDNILRCNKSGQASNPEAILYAAQSFCRDIVAKNKNNGYYWSNDRLEGKKTPSTGYHFQLDFSVRKGCLWKANFDECMKYMQVAIDGCNGSRKGDKLGGWVRDNCIEAIINPRKGA